MNDEITPETIALNQTDCDKCCGTGFVFQRSVLRIDRTLAVRPRNNRKDSSGFG